MADALRKDTVSYTGYRRNGRKTTPRIDELASEATWYQNAVAPGPATKYSQTSFMTGQYHSNTDFTGSYTELGGQEIMPEVLDSEGYRTLGIHTAQLAKDDGFLRGFDRYVMMGELPAFKPDPDYITSGLYNALVGKDSRTRHINSILEDFISETEEDPFFAYVCYTNTHTPYRAPYPYGPRISRTPGLLEGRYVEKKDGVNYSKIVDLKDHERNHDIIAGNIEIDEKESDALKSFYDASAASLDMRIGEVIDHLKQEGEYENTMIVVTSDHGELFGEEGLYYHAYSVREELINVPMIVKYPESGAGEDVEETVSQLDIFPTICDLIDYDKGKVQYDGKSLLDGGSDTVFSEMARPTERRLDDLEEKGGDPDRFDRGVKVARRGNFKLVMDSGGSVKLHELPGEETDVSGSHPDIVDELQEAIEERLGGFWEGQESEIERTEEIKEELERLGYF